MRLWYRARQFGQYLTARLGPAERESVARQLGPRLAALFAQMSPAEQAHSYRVAQALRAQGHTEPVVYILIAKGHAVDDRHLGRSLP